MTAALIFVDLDGTLVGPSGDVSPSVWPRLDAARAAGVRFSVCTGRPSGGVASRVAGRLDPDTPHIFHGGGVVRRVGPGGVDAAPDHAAAIDRATAAAWVGKARARALTLELYTADAIWVDDLTPEAVEHARLLGTQTRAHDLLALVEAEPIVKMQWVIRGDEARAAEVAAEPIPGCHTARGTSPVMPTTAFLTITRADAHKGAAVARVAAALGIGLARTASIGDSTGDLPMLEMTGRGFVMGDAPASMRARWETVGGVETDGVIDVLDALGL